NLGGLDSTSCFCYSGKQDQKFHFEKMPELVKNKMNTSNFPTKLAVMYVFVILFILFNWLGGFNINKNYQLIRIK
ncbi:MAG: hypothetical protein ACE5J0_03240, partial [Candidatus Paceibacterales bacterium]